MIYISHKTATNQIVLNFKQRQLLTNFFRLNSNRLEFSNFSFQKMIALTGPEIDVAPPLIH